MQIQYIVEKRNHINRRVWKYHFWSSLKAISNMALILGKKRELERIKNLIFLWALLWTRNYFKSFTFILSFKLYTSSTFVLQREKLRCRKVKNFPKFTQLVDDSTGSEPSHLTQEPRVLPPHMAKILPQRIKMSYFSYWQQKKGKKLKTIKEIEPLKSDRR